MKKLLVWFFIFIMHISVAQAADNENIPVLQKYKVADITFSIPQYFVELNNNEHELSFVGRNNTVVLRVALLDGEKMDVDAAAEKLRAMLGVTSFEYHKETINDIPFLNCSFSDSVAQVQGYAALFIDYSSDTDYLICYMSTAGFDNEDAEIWNTLLNSIHAPTILPTSTAEPTPTPTPAPTTSEFFDYDAIITEPDTYKGFYYSLVCDVAHIDEVDMDILNWTRPVMALMSIDGNIGKVAYIVFNNPDEAIKKGDTVHMFVEFVNVTDMQTALGFYVKTPMFLAYRIEEISK